MLRERAGDIASLPRLRRPRQPRRARRPIRSRTARPHRARWLIAAASPPCSPWSATRRRRSGATGTTLDRRRRPSPAPRPRRRRYPAPRRRLGRARIALHGALATSAIPSRQLAADVRLTRDLGTAPTIAVRRRRSAVSDRLHRPQPDNEPGRAVHRRRSTAIDVGAHAAPRTGRRRRVSGRRGSISRPAIDQVSSDDGHRVTLDADAAEGDRRSGGLVRTCTGTVQSTHAPRGAARPGLRHRARTHSTCSTTSAVAPGSVRSAVPAEDRGRAAHPAAVSTARSRRRPPGRRS